MEKSSINIVVIGEVGSGKSTTAGHLIHNLGGIEQRLVKRFEKEASQKRMKMSSRECFKYSWVLDKLESEKDRGISIDNTIGRFETDRYCCTIIDPPGHPDSIKDMMRAISQADVALLIIDCTRSGFKLGMKNSRIFELALLAYGLGVKYIITCCNKMDKTGYSQVKYNATVGEVSSCLKEAGYMGEFVVFVPMSGLRGDNLFETSTELGWHTGLTLLEAIDGIKEPSRPVNNPLRVPIQQFHKIFGLGTVAVGRVQAGELKCGMEVIVGPIGLAATVKSIEMHGYDLDVAFPGDNIRFNLGDFPIKDLEQGHVVSDSNFIPAEEVLSFTATVTMKKCRKPITKGCTATMHCNMFNGTVKLDDLTSIIDSLTGDVIENQPKSLNNGESGIVKMIPTRRRRMVVETYSDCPPLGRFVLRDTHHTIAIGLITSVKKKDQSTEKDMRPHNAAIKQEEESGVRELSNARMEYLQEQALAHYLRVYGRKSLSPINSHVNEDLLTLILVRLPIRSICRFKCVSRSWNALISSHGFIRLHLHLHQSHMDRNPTFLFWEDVLDKQGRRTSLPIQTVEFLMDSRLSRCEFKQLHDPIKSSSTWTCNFKDIVGCCDGLLCLMFRSSLVLSCDDVYAICLWNPLTKAIWVLPTAPYFDHRKKKDIGFYGFGYDDVSDDYKVIIAIRLDGPVEFGYAYEVYSLKTDSWSQEVSYISSGIHANKGFGEQGVSVNGALHWLYSSYDDERKIWRKSILAIDLGTEKHRLLPVPEVIEQKHLRLVVLDGCLLLIDGLSPVDARYRWSIKTYKYDMWMMKDYGPRDSWTRIVSIHNMPNDVGECTTPLAISSERGRESIMFCSDLSLIESTFRSYDVFNNQVVGRTVTSCVVGVVKGMRHQFVGSLVRPQSDQFVGRKLIGNPLAMDMHDLLRSRGGLVETVLNTKKRSHDGR